MAITNMTVKNMLGFHGEGFQMEFSDGINVMIGQNDTGKTSLLKMIYAATQWSRRSLKKQVDLANSSLIRSAMRKTCNLLAHSLISAISKYLEKKRISHLIFLTVDLNIPIGSN